jgi:hypothetical protein
MGQVGGFRHVAIPKLKRLSTFGAKRRILQASHDAPFIFLEVLMRFVLKIELATEAANALAKKGTMGSTIHQIVEEQKPEAAYFTEINGRRTALLIVDLNDASKIPALAEPWFLAFNANIEFSPAMVASDLAKAGADIERAAKKYG